MYVYTTIQLLTGRISPPFVCGAGNSWNGAHIVEKGQKTQRGWCVGKGIFTCLMFM